MRKRKILSFLLAFVLACHPVTSLAEEPYRQEKENILAAIAEMEEILKTSYQQTRKQASQLAEQGYDYELTMESIDMKDKPWTKFPYREFIAAYASIRAYASNDPSVLGEGINEIQFFQYDYEAQETIEYIPKALPWYADNGDGTYKRDGIYFIMEPCMVPVYKEQEDGSHIQTGERMEYLEKTVTRYADVTITMTGIDQIYEVFGLSREDFKEEEDARLAKIRKIMGEADLSQSLFLSFPEKIGDTEQSVIEHAIQMTDSPVRQAFILTAASIIGRVPYEWGGKASFPGFDPSWYTFDSSGRQKGLDCSGYTQWVMRTAGYKDWAQFGWTGDYLSHKELEPINRTELMPGDFGLYYPNTDQVNHIGIYLGNGYWIHCSSSSNTVSINNNMKFSVFRRLKGMDQYRYQDGTNIFASDQNVAGMGEYEETDEKFAQTLLLAQSGGLQSLQGNYMPIDDPDLMLMAKIVQLESHGEGYNGWTAVAEVIRNRILSEDFPDTVREVVSAPRQFATWNRSQSMSDSEVDPDILKVCKEVMAGTLSYLNNTEVIGFRTKRPEPEDQTFNGWDRFMTLGNHTFYIFRRGKAATG